MPVSLDVDAYPFPKAPFQDVLSPRQMAEQMRRQPKAAMPLLENGEVQRWFTANGWTYPVSGPPASGVAAVQQFFEGMGLSKPPALQLSEDQVNLLCIVPEVVTGKVVLRTPAKKWVYAQCVSDSSWLRVTTPAVSGPQQAVIEFEVDSTILEPNRVHTGSIQLTANAGQTLVFFVQADVRKPHEPFTRRLLRPFLTGAILALAFRLLIAAPADLQARVLTATGPTPGSFSTWLESPIATTQAAEHYIRQFVLTTWWVGAVAGVVLLWRRRSQWSDPFFGGIAGAVAGIAGSASAACLLAVIDGLPRLAWEGLNGLVGGTELGGSGLALDASLDSPGRDVLGGPGRVSPVLCCGPWGRLVSPCSPVPPRRWPGCAAWWACAGPPTFSRYNERAAQADWNGETLRTGGENLAGDSRRCLTAWAVFPSGPARCCGPCVMLKPVWSSTDKTPEEVGLDVGQDSHRTHDAPQQHRRRRRIGRQLRPRSS